MPTKKVTPEMQIMFRGVAATIEDIEYEYGNGSITGAQAGRKLRTLFTHADKIHQQAPSTQISTESQCLEIQSLYKKFTGKEMFP